MYEFDAEWMQKLEDLRSQGVQPYPNGMKPTAVSSELHRRWEGVEDPSEEPDAQGVAVAGRLMFRNRMGKAMFLRIMDRGDSVVVGTKDDGEPDVRHGIIQAWLRKDEVGAEVFEQMKKLDIGDFVWVKGTMMRTRTGELTVRATEVKLASKILQPFPDRFHGLTDVEQRSRQRYVDLFMNPETRDTFRARSKIIRFIRNFFEDRDFLEVETPMMQPIPGGAAARPFVTHHNALDMPLFLRIAPELFLKRLLVGGLERVFEINRSFRNEGVSVKHNPEFTMLEFYQAWATVDDLMDLTEELLVGLVAEVKGEQRTVSFNGMDIDFSPPFRRASMDELIVEHTALSADEMRDADALRAFWVAEHGEPTTGTLPTSYGKWWELLFDEYVEARLVNPTFVTGFPAEISPLSRRSDDDPEIVDRFELIVGTWELANAFSELNDPVDQAGRFADQVQARDAGDAEAMYFDSDYVRALSYGMPPAAGQGIGIDRLVMMLTGRTSIREVILFPTLRPEKSTSSEPA